MLLMMIFSTGTGLERVEVAGRARDASNRSTAVEPRNVAGAPPLPLDEGKEKINLITYPGGSDYLKSAV